MGQIQQFEEVEENVVAKLNNVVQPITPVVYEQHQK